MDIKRRILAALFITMVGMTACASEVQETKAEQTDTKKQTLEENVAIPEETAKAEELTGIGTLGEYAVEIKNYEFTKDYAGNPAIIVTYSFTNNSAEECSAMAALSAQAFQNGVQLETAIVENVDIDNSMKNLKQGASLDIKEAYLLTSDTSPVEFEITELMAFSEEKLGQTFVLKEGGETIYPKAPVGEVEKILGDYTVSVVDYQKAKDYEGKPVIVINFGFTNNSNKTVSYMTALHCTAYQNGVELESAIISDTNIAVGTSQMANIRPGAGIPVAVAFVLSDEVSPVEVEFSEFLSFNDDKLETIIEVAN